MGAGVTAISAVAVAVGSAVGSRGDGRFGRRGRPSARASPVGVGVGVAVGSSSSSVPAMGTATAGAGTGSMTWTGGGVGLRGRAPRGCRRAGGGGRGDDLRGDARARRAGRAGRSGARPRRRRRRPRPRRRRPRASWSRRRRAPQSRRLRCSRRCRRRARGEPAAEQQRRRAGQQAGELDVAVLERLAVGAAVLAHAQVVAQQPRRAAGAVDGQRELLADLPAVGLARLRGVGEPAARSHEQRLHGRHGDADRGGEVGVGRWSGRHSP